MKTQREFLYFLASLVGQLVVGLLLGFSLLPSFYFLRWSWSVLGTYTDTVLGVLGLGFSLGVAFLLFGNTLLILIVLVRNLFRLRNHEQRAAVVSLVTIKVALYDLLLHLANTFFIPVLKGSYFSLLFYRGMGAKIGKGTLIATHRLWDCDLIEIGEFCIIGSNSSISAHVLQGDRGRMRRVRIGNNVTIGANTSVMPGVVIEDNVIVGPSSLVPMGMRLESGKSYIGVPVKQVSRKD